MIRINVGTRFTNSYYTFKVVQLKGNRVVWEAVDHKAGEKIGFRGECLITDVASLIRKYGYVATWTVEFKK